MKIQRCYNAQFLSLLKLGSVDAHLGDCYPVKDLFLRILFPFNTSLRPSYFLQELYGEKLWCTRRMKYIMPCWSLLVFSLNYLNPIRLSSISPLRNILSSSLNSKLVKNIILLLLDNGNVREEVTEQRCCDADQLLAIKLILWFGLRWLDWTLSNVINMKSP